MNPLSSLKVNLFLDSADISAMLSAYHSGVIRGFTTNPTLMKKCGVGNYEAFAKEILKSIADMPISFEVFSDDFMSMEREARLISSWGKNVFVKIPVTNTKGDSSIMLIKKLSGEGLRLNVTAILTTEQVKSVTAALSGNAPAIISVFAGRIADTGIDPVAQMKEASRILQVKKNIQLLWASTREVLNIFQAESAGCGIITITNDILKKLPLVGKDLSELSLDTVKMFYKDAQEAGYKL